MNILVLNCGSSTVKFQIISTDLELSASDRDQRLAWGLLERIGGDGQVAMGSDGQAPAKKAMRLADHRAAIDVILKWIVSPEAGIRGIKTLADIHAVGHRVVHGAERFQASAVIDNEVLKMIEECVDLAPLHNPANLKGILAAQELLGKDIPQVAVFDTAFHSTMPEVSYIYGIPYKFYTEHKIRRYGFHGTSHRYVSYRYRTMYKLKPEQVHVITLHLGSGCSACAVKEGKSFDTSMGFTPLEGLLMGTRCGDIDPSLIFHLARKNGMNIEQIDSLLNKQSGLLGVSGHTNDMRDLLKREAQKDRLSTLAIDLFCQRVKRYIGTYLAEMGGADAVIFTGGIGENSPEIRERICRGLECFGLSLDEKKNRAGDMGKGAEVSVKGSRLKACVIPTNEELLIARDTVRVVEKIPT